MSDCDCMDCGRPYPMELDMLIPRTQWLMIHPDDGGVLCASCIVRRASKLPDAINITGIITFADDYGEGGNHPYFALTKMLDDKTGEGAFVKGLLDRTNAAEAALVGLGYRPTEAGRWEKS